MQSALGLVLKIMKVYTKTGDKGTTALIGGKRVSKSHYRLEAYGTVDELMSYVGLIHDQLDLEKDKRFLIEIQNNLMICAAVLATDCDDCDMNIPQIKEAEIINLEKYMDKLDKTLPPLTKFILPGGHTTVSFCHIARTVCRRAERLSSRVQEEDGKSEMVVKYLNRLSDFLFVFARKLGKDLKIVEIHWIPTS